MIPRCATPIVGTDGYIQSPNLLSERHFTTHTRTITTQKADKSAEASRLSLINTKKKTF